MARRATDARPTRYQAVEESSDTRGVAPPDSWDPDTVEDWLTEVATSVTDGETPLATVSLFDQGFDRCVSAPARRALFPRGSG